MTTYSHARPSLEARAQAASLIVVGTVEDGPLSHMDYATDPPQIHSRFRVAVDDALSGRAPGGALIVRVVGGQVGEQRTEWSCVMREGDRVLLFLTPYFAAQQEEDSFVPYFRGCFRVSADGVVELDAQGLRDVYSRAEERPEALTIESVRAFVQAAIQKREQADARLPEREEEEPRATPDVDNTMVPVEPGGARWATLDNPDAGRQSGG